MKKPLLIALALALSGTAAHAETTWIMASGYTDSSFLTKNIRAFIDEVETKSNGELKIDLRPADSLVKLDAIKRAVQSGQVQLGEIRLSVYGNEGAMYNLDNTPGVASDFDAAWRLMEAQKPFFEKLFAKNRMAIISYTAWPGQGFYTKNPINSASDLEGLKLRIYSKQTQVLGEKLGTEAVILPFAEVPQAFATGMINALWTSAQSGTEVQAWDYAKYFTYTGTLHQKNAIIVNSAALNALDENLQKIVIEAGEAATIRGWEMAKAAAQEKEALLAQNGMIINQAPQDVMDKLEVIGAEMTAEWLTTANDQEKEIYDNYRAAKEQ